MRRVAVAALLVAMTGAAQAAAAGRILVIPFDNPQRDNRIFWLGEAASVLLTDDLNAFGAGAITRTERQQAFDRLQVPPAAALTDATVIRIGQLVGAGQVILGSLQLEGDVLVARARRIALDSGRVEADVTERGPLPELFATFERLAGRIAPDAVKTTGEIPPAHPPVAAFENFIKGLLAETPSTAVDYLETALKLAPTFDRARLALWDVYADQGDHDSALDAIRGVAADSPYARRARFLAGISQLNLEKDDEAFATFRALADAQPTATILNNLGIVQLRRGATPQTGLPTYYFAKAAAADPDDVDYLFNLGYAYWRARDPQAAIYWLRETVRRNPADADAHYVLAAALASGGNATEASRERELAARLSAVYEPRDKRAGVEPAPVPGDLERIKQEVELPRRRVDAALATSEQRSQEDLARFYLDRGRRLFEQEHDRDAVDELNRAVYLSPYLADAHLLLGRIHLRNGRAADAIDAFKIAVWSAETADAHALLGEAFRQARDLAAARNEADRALTIDPSSAEAKALLARLDGR